MMGKLSTRRYVDRVLRLHAREVDRRFDDVKTAVELARAGSREVKGEGDRHVATSLAVIGLVIALVAALVALVALVRNGTVG